jgi:NAD(P)-dependent dehydrogenase (short-subunit alcohol dehydrogenase family)
MDERTCFIIGAAGGIGRALVARLASARWRLVLAGRHGEPLEQLAGDVGATVEVLDATDFDAVAEAVARQPKIDGAVNLAGSILLRSAHGTSAEEFDQTIDLNLRTAFALVRAAGKSMRAEGGSVVLMSSCVAEVGLANHEAIAAAKAAVEGLVRAAAATYAPQGLRFNAVAPGLVDTPLSGRITSNELSLKAAKAMHPLRRIGSADEVARCIEFLLDPGAAWITGQVLGVDGGLAAARSR